jgi:tetratricopeptide (TPR) repeat protein
LVLARALIEEGALDAAIAECERALQINPSHVNAIARLGDCYALLGRSAEAIDASLLALKLDSRGPEGYRRHFTMALAHFAAGNDADAMKMALKEASQVARWRPDFIRADLLAAAAAAALGRKGDMEAAVSRCRQRYPDLDAATAVPRIMPPFARPTDRARLTEQLRAAGLQE